jgi:hypothetical protein
LDFARAIRGCLQEDADVTVWNEGPFGIGKTIIESLESLPHFDFAILVLTPDDLVHSRNVESLGPRDNVIFELGLFTGRIGRSRTFVVHQANAQVKIPTDLSGVIAAQYSWPRDDKNHQAAVGAACDEIRTRIRELGVSEEKRPINVKARSPHPPVASSSTPTLHEAEFPKIVFITPAVSNFFDKIVGEFAVKAHDKQKNIVVKPTLSSP